MTPCDLRLALPVLQRMLRRKGQSYMPVKSPMQRTHIPAKPVAGILPISAHCQGDLGWEEVEVEPWALFPLQKRRTRPHLVLEHQLVGLHRGSFSLSPMLDARAILGVPERLRLGGREVERIRIAWPRGCLRGLRAGVCHPLPGLAVGLCGPWSPDSLAPLRHGFLVFSLHRCGWTQAPRSSSPLPSA